jgi:hypothetical protein
VLYGEDQYTNNLRMICIEESSFCATERMEAKVCHSYWGRNSCWVDTKKDHSPKFR